MCWKVEGGSCELRHVAMVIELWSLRKIVNSSVGCEVLLGGIV